MFKYRRQSKQERSHKGFTLAEVLLALTIIGIIASLTLPSLISNYKNRITVIRLKKVYSELSNAFKSFQADDRNIESYFSTTSASTDGRDAFGTKLIYIKKGAGSFSPTIIYKYLDNTPWTDFSWDNRAAVLNDGTIINVVGYALDCQAVNNDFDDVCAEIRVDVNGNNPPNQLGRDLFNFWVTKHGVFPDGAQVESWGIDACLDPPAQGWYCAHKVLIEDDITY